VKISFEHNYFYKLFFWLVSMQGELLDFISQYELSPFESGKTSIRRGADSIFKTNDAKAIFTKVLNKLSTRFVFSETTNLWHHFSFLSDFSDIEVRQNFFRSLPVGKDSSFLTLLKKPRKDWSPQYDIVVVTEDEHTFTELQKMDCPVKLLFNENDLSDLERYDIVQILDCETYGGVLERLPQGVFIDDISNVYLERFLEVLSGWRENILVLEGADVSSGIAEIVSSLKPLFDLITNKGANLLTVEYAEEVLEEINEALNDELRLMTITGDSLVKILSEGKMPPHFEDLISGLLNKSGLPSEIFNLKIPLDLDRSSLDAAIMRQSANEFTNLAEEVKRRSAEVKRIPELLARLSSLLIFEDFSLGVSTYLSEFSTYPRYTESFGMSESQNYFISGAQEISFSLDRENQCSILTGANSGGKTTLLEHVLQNITFYQLGLPISGEVSMPVFTDVYYFAKTKGSAGSGAFETLLSQMSKIKPGARTLILADEIEAVTEPGVAGKIISATAEYFISRGCFLIVATHLGYEIAQVMPNRARIDGIEAKGLDADFNLIVDHNPVLGRLAHSTPELIVEKMANMYDAEYFTFLRDHLKK
jgi:DNA mismatch repair protein MutS2